MSLLYKKTPLVVGYTKIIHSGNSELKFLELGKLYLNITKQEHYIGYSEDKEVVLDIFQGLCAITVENNSLGILKYENVGGRENIFSGKPSMVYIPCKSKYTIKTIKDQLLVGIVSAPSELETRPEIITSDKVSVVPWGKELYRRDLYMGINETVNAQRLFVGETYNPPGHWSSYPPHKHDTLNLPHEAPYEEIYLFFIRPVQGFAFQRIYTDAKDPEPLDEIFVIENEDAVAIPRGYHPVVGAPGYEACFLWALAGQRRKFGEMGLEAKHNWLLDYRTE